MLDGISSMPPVTSATNFAPLLGRTGWQLDYDNLPGSVDRYGQVILPKRARIKRQTIEHRRLQRRGVAA